MSIRDNLLKRYGVANRAPDSDKEESGGSVREALLKKYSAENNANRQNAVSSWVNNYNAAIRNPDGLDVGKIDELIRQYDGIKDYASAYGLTDAHKFGRQLQELRTSAQKQKQRKLETDLLHPEKRVQQEGAKMIPSALLQATKPLIKIDNLTPVEPVSEEEVLELLSGMTKEEEEKLLEGMTPTLRRHHETSGGFVDTTKSWEEKTTAVSKLIIEGRDGNYTATDKLLKQLKARMKGNDFSTDLYELAGEASEDAKLQRCYNALITAKNKDILSKTKMDGTNKTVLEEIKEISEMGASKTKDQRKETVFKKMEELGIPAEDYALFTDDSNFTWDALGSFAGNAAMAGLVGFNKSIVDTADAIFGNLTRGLGWTENNPFTIAAEYTQGLYDTNRLAADLAREKLGDNDGYGGLDFAQDATEGITGALPHAITAYWMGLANASGTVVDLSSKAAYEAGNWLTKAGITVESMLKNPSGWLSFISSYGSDYKEAKASGASDTVAALGATVTSLINAAIETGLDGGSGIQGLPEDLLNGNKNKAWAWVKSGLEEAGEEPMQKFVGELVTKTMYDHNADILNPLEYARDSAIGLVSGLSLGSGQIGLDTGAKAINWGANKLQQLAQDKVNAEQDALQKLADEMHGVSETENTAQMDGVKYSIKRTQNMSWDEQINGALSHNGSVVHSDTLVLDDTPATLVSDGIENKKLAVPLSVITKAKSGKDASHSIQDANLKDLQRGVRNAPIVINNPSRNALVFVTDILQDGAPVLVAFQKNAKFDGDDVHKATSIHLQMDVASMLKALPSDATIYAKNESELDTAAGITDSLRSISAGVKFTGDTVTENVAGVNGEISTSEGQVVRNSDGVTVQIADVERAGNGKLTVRMTDGSTADISELSFPNMGEQELWRVLAEYSEDAEHARQLLKEYRAGDLGAFEYAKGVEEGFIYGKLNIDGREMSRRGSFVNRLNPMQKNMAYKYGQFAGEKQAKRRKAEASERNAKRERKGGVYYGYEGQALDKSKLNKAQRVGVNFAERLARRKGITTYFYRSYINEQGERVYKDRNGNIVPANENGWYDPSDGSIHIDLNCGDMGSTVLCTIAHELTHFIQDWSADKYRTLCKILTEGYLEMGQSVDELVRNKQEEYRKRKIELSYEEAFDEVIASSMEGVLNDGRVMDLLDDVETKDMSLADRIRSFLEDTAELIRDTIQAYRDVKPESPEGKIVQRMQGIHDQLQEVFTAGLHEGGENYRQGGKINTAQTGGVKNSFVGYAEDGKGIYKSNFPKGTPKKAKGERILQYIRDVWSKKPITLRIEKDGQVKYIEAQFDPTYDESGNTPTDASKLMGGNRHGTSAEQRVTLDLADDYYQLAEESQYNYSKKEEGKTTDPHKDVRWWHYFVNDIYFAEYDSNALVPYTVSINVKEKDNGHFVYSFSAEKTEGTSTQRTLHAAVNSSDSAANGSSSNKSIRNPQKKVNKNSVTNSPKSIRYQKNALAQEQLERENAAMSEDVAGLNELVAAMRRQGKDGGLETGTLDAAASVLMQKAGAKGKKTELMKLLDQFYQFVGGGQEMTWDSIRKAAQPAVNWLMDHVVRGKQVSQYAKDVLHELQTSRIYLDETQKAEAAHQFGSFGAFRQMLMGSVTIANEGSISLDSRWHELSQLYPDVFREDVSAADMPGELADIINRMRNTDTSELEFEYNRDLMEQELLYRIYGSYWNASTLYIVAGQHEAQIRQLKGKHNQRMNQVYQRHRDMEERQRQSHRQRQEAARHHYEEQYQKREAEYRESRRKAVERHDVAQIRQQIKKDVAHLDSLLNKGTKNKNVKLGLQEFVGAALRTAKGVFLNDYNEYDMIRNGLQNSLLPEEQAAFDRCRELLKELDKLQEVKNAEPGADNFHDKWDPEQAIRRDDREEALKRELYQNVRILRDGNVFQRERAGTEQATAEELLNELLGAYKTLENSELEHIRGVYNEALYKQIEKVKNFLSGKAIKDMSPVELKELQKMYRMVSHTVSHANELFGKRWTENVRERGEKAIRQLRTAVSKDMPALLEKLSSFGWSILSLDTAMEIIGSDVLIEHVQELYDAEDTYQRDLEHARQFAEDQAKKYGRKNWKLDKQVSFAGTEITLGQAMALYAYSRRKQGQSHLEGDGFTHSKNVRIKKSLSGKMPVQLGYIKNATRNYKVTREMYTELEKLLTAEQREYVKAMQEYLSKVMGAKGNEVSEQLHGIPLFEETIYFPLKTAREFSDAALGATTGERKMKNTGFTEAVKKGADNAIVLDDFERVWSEHVNQMSNYHAYVLAMENFNRVYNYRHAVEQEVRDAAGEVYKTELVDTNESVKLDIENRVGSAANAYIVKYMQNLNGGTRSDATEALANGLLGNFRKTRVLGSGSVIVQQPSAFLRAMAKLDVRDLADWKQWREKYPKPPEGLKNEMYRYCPVAGIKKMGGFDPSVGRTARQYLFGEYHDGENPVQRVTGWVNEKLGMLPEAMDEVTWTYIWFCSKQQIRRTHTDLRVGSKPFCEEAAKLFSQIVRETQVYDSITVKPLIMQSKNTYLKTLTSFMNEPLKGLNQTIRAWTRVKQGKIKARQAVRETAAVFAADLAAGALSAFFYAFRDDDDDETYWEKYLSALTGKAWESLIPLYKLPYIKDVLSLVEGYDSSRSDTALVSELITGLENIFKPSTATTPKEKEEEVWDRLEKGYGYLLNFVGIPGSNLIREIRGIYRTAKKTLEKSWVDPTAAGTRYALIEGLPLAKDVSKQKQLENAVAEGDVEHLVRVLGTWDNQDTAISNLRTAIRDVWTAGQTTDDRAMEYLQEFAGHDAEEAQDYITTWEFHRDHPESNLTGAKIVQYVDVAEPAGISLEAYTQFVEQTKDLTSDEDEGGQSKQEKVWTVIHGLPLSRKQKDALHYASGYKESSLDETPWN